MLRDDGIIAQAIVHRAPRHPRAQRDIKPDNILCADRDQGLFKLADFGLACKCGPDGLASQGNDWVREAEAPHLSTSPVFAPLAKLALPCGHVAAQAGTPGYMGPEMVAEFIREAGEVEVVLQGLPEEARGRWDVLQHHPHGKANDVWCVCTLHCLRPSKRPWRARPSVQRTGAMFCHAHTLSRRAIGASVYQILAGHRPYLVPGTRRVSSSLLREPFKTQARFYPKRPPEP